MANLYRLASIVLALALTVAAGVTPAAPQPALPGGAGTGSAYTADISVFLESVHWYERGIKAMPLPKETFQREFVQAMLASLTPAQFYAKATPVIARYITPAQAATLSAMAGKRPVPMGQQQAALQAYWTMEKKVGLELGPVWRELSIEFMQRLEGRAIAEIRRGVAELAEHPGTPKVPRLNKVGLPYLDRLAELTVYKIREEMNGSDTMTQACREAGMETALRAASLMAKDGIPAARRALDGCERALETKEKNSERVFTEVRAGVLAMELPASGRVAAILDREAGAFHLLALKYGELNRQLLAAQRRIVDLVESRRATMSLEGEQLRFTSEADVAEFNRNIGDVESLAKAIKDLAQQQRQQGILRNMDLGDGVIAE